MNLKEIGELVKQRRDFLKLRQEDLADLSGTTIKTIHLIEQGTGNPSFNTLNRLSIILGLEIEVQVKIHK